MTPRAVFKWSLIVLAALLVIREFGWIDWKAFRSRSETSSSMATIYGPDLSSVRLDGFNEAISLDEKQTKPIGLGQSMTLHYARHASYPWTRWLPLYKTGETLVQESFFVTRGADTLISGKRVQRVSVTAKGSLSARGYAALAIDGSLDSLRTDLTQKLKEAEASPAARATTTLR